VRRRRSAEREISGRKMYLRRVSCVQPLLEQVELLLRIVIGNPFAGSESGEPTQNQSTCPGAELTSGGAAVPALPGEMTVNEARRGAPKASTSFVERASPKQPNTDWDMEKLPTDIILEGRKSENAGTKTVFRCFRPRLDQAAKATFRPQFFLKKLLAIWAATDK